VVIEGESVKIFATIPLPNKIHEREMDKTDIPGTFNAGATLGPVNETNMTRIWNKHKQTNTPLKRKVFVALSGGVDSSVAAALLKKQGYNVTGVFMKNWSDPAWPCAFKEDRQDAMRVCAQLNVPFKTFDFTKEYKNKVVDYMVKGYTAGLTPNPDVMCNKEIKFGLFLKKARAQGADFIATGHYVKNQKSKFKNQNDKSKFKIIYKLYQAKDKNKDQSYFLWTLTQEQLKYCLFPIGEITSKAKVRVLAKKFGLATAQKKDSQGICFMGPIKIKEFIKPFVNSKEKSGLIITTSGKTIGQHQGLDFFTIGQRQGIGIGGTGPYYVAKKDYKTNTLIVASSKNDPALASKILLTNQVNFIAFEPKKNLAIKAAVRYRQKPMPAILSKKKNNIFQVQFKNPIRAATPGQSVVFYKNQELLGGGIITKTF